MVYGNDTVSLPRASRKEKKIVYRIATETLIIS